MLVSPFWAWTPSPARCPGTLAPQNGTAIRPHDPLSAPAAGTHNQARPKPSGHPSLTHLSRRNSMSDPNPVRSHPALWRSRSQPALRRRPHPAAPVGRACCTLACWPSPSRPIPPSSPHRNCPPTCSTPAAANAFATTSAVPATASSTPPPSSRATSTPPDSSSSSMRPSWKRCGPPATAPWPWTPSSTSARSIRCSTPDAACT